MYSKLCVHAYGENSNQRVHLTSSTYARREIQPNCTERGATKIYSKFYEQTYGEKQIEIFCHCALTDPYSWVFALKKSAKVYSTNWFLFIDRLMRFIVKNFNIYIK